MGDSVQVPGVHLLEQAAQLGRRLLLGAGDPLPGDGDFLLLGMDVDDGTKSSAWVMNRLAKSPEKSRNPPNRNTAIAACSAEPSSACR